MADIKSESRPASNRNRWPASYWNAWPASSESAICRKAGISQATYFNWKKKYEGLQPPEMRRLKQLEDENAKLKKIVADLSLDREMLQDVIRRKL